MKGHITGIAKNGIVRYKQSLNSGQPKMACIQGTIWFKCLEYLPKRPVFKAPQAIPEYRPFVAGIQGIWSQGYRPPVFKTVSLDSRYLRQPWIQVDCYSRYHCFTLCLFLPSGQVETSMGRIRRSCAMFHPQIIFVFALLILPRCQHFRCL